MLGGQGVGGAAWRSGIQARAEPLIGGGIEGAELLVGHACLPASPRASKRHAAAAQLVP